jgi:hypothetical protein
LNVITMAYALQELLAQAVDDRVMVSPKSPPGSRRLRSFGLGGY